ncbi:MAG: YceD family protein [Rhodoglobus sp.]
MSRISESPYAVLVRDLMHRPGEMRQHEQQITVAESFGNAVIVVAAGSQLKIFSRLESLHDGVLVAAEVSAIATAECVRCLIDMTMPVEVEFQELFAYSEDEAFDYTVIDEHIDLEPVVRDAVVLSLPFQPVCQKGCLGLCPECGVRLLDNPEHHHEAPIDSRWAALSGLQDFSQDVHEANDSPETQEEKS